MEKTVMNDFIHSMKSALNLKETDIRTYSPLILAYIGDGVFELVIRSFVINTGNMQVNKMHHHTSSIVKASTQAKMAEYIMQFLNDDELSYYKRGRNAKSHTSAKNQSTIDYRKATGLECLMGYLYLTGENDRMMELIKLGLTGIGEIKNDL